MKVYRIEKIEFKDESPPRGSLNVPGRWSTTDMWVVYTSENIALAKLETLANCGSKIPEHRVLRIFEIDDRAPMVEISENDLPDNWNAIPYPSELASIIKGIIESKKFVSAIVPAVQSRYENNILLFPDFPDFNKYVMEVDVNEEYFDSRLKGTH